MVVFSKHPAYHFITLSLYEADKLFVTSCYQQPLTLLEQQILFRVHDHVGELVTVVCVSIFRFGQRYTEVAHSVAYQVRDLLPFDLHADLLILRDVVAIDDRIRCTSQLLDRALLCAVDACGAGMGSGRWRGERREVREWREWRGEGKE